VVIRWIGFLIILFLSAAEIWANESPSLPIDHEAYEGIERLKSRGLFRPLLLDAKPLNRYSVAHPLVDLLASINQEDFPEAVFKPGVQEELLKLLNEFQEEVDDLEGTAPRRFFSFHLADPLSIEIGYASFSKDRLRLRENHQGDYFSDGFNQQIKIRSWGVLGKQISWFVVPKVTTNRDGSVLEIEEGLLKFGFKNFEIGVGRESLWWGPGYNGALLLSNNAPPMNLIRAGSREAFQLPGFLEPLGFWQLTGFLARLEEDRDISHPLLLGLRIGYSPSSFLEIGLNRMTMWEGKGRPGLSFTEFLELYFSKPNKAGDFEVNELGSVDVKINLPTLPLIQGGNIYGEIGGEDEAGFFPADIGFLAGIYLTGLFNQPAFDFRTEYANNHVPGTPNVWYVHSTYTSGYTHKGVILGHPMGIDSDSIFFQLSKELVEDLSILFSFDQERHFLSSPVKERKREFIFEIKSRFGWLKPVWILTYEYEAIQNYNGINGEKAKNHTFISRTEFSF
jgi:hypothetical protein